MPRTTAAAATTQPARRAVFVRVTERRTGAVDCFATRNSPRKASLTAAAFGNAVAMSGSSTTTLLLCIYRWKYFPRMPLAKSHSGRISSVFALGLRFIVQSLSLCPAPRADHSNVVIVLGMRDNEQAPERRHADRQGHSHRGRIRAPRATGSPASISVTR